MACRHLLSHQRQARRRLLSTAASTTAGFADITVSYIGMMSSNSTVLRARIFGTPTGHALLESCPHEMTLSTYGAEVYGALKVPLPAIRQQPLIPPGGLAYSQKGNYFCVFFGQDPAWPVDYIGQIEDGWEALRTGPWTDLRVQRVGHEEQGS